MKSFKEKCNILIADDDLEDYELFQDGLLETGLSHSIAHVKHGEKVITAIKAVIPDVIFLDINMPGCDGRDCLALIKKDSEISHIPIIMYSTSNAKQWIDQCYDLGANRYFVKPTQFGAIVEGLKKIFSMPETELYKKPPFEKFVITEND